jgi:hypothetical protein
VYLLADVNSVRRAERTMRPTLGAHSAQRARQRLQYQLPPFLI